MLKEIAHRKTHTRAGNARLISELNKVKVINLVRDNDGISRADLAKRSGLSAPTISRIIEGLIREGLVTEIGAGVSHGGRKPTLLRFSGIDSYIIGIDLGTTNIYGVLTDLDANVIAEIRTPTRVERGFDQVMERTSEVIGELRGHLGSRKGRICGIGLAIAGLINREREIVEFSPDFHWHDVDVRAALGRKHPDIPIIFDNVTRVMALGEIWYGAGRNYQDFVMVNVGYGIGAGVIIRGTPLYGSLGMAGEFGHITFDKDSEAQCECGNFGCLEALSSGNAIAKAARKELERGAASDLLGACDGDPARLDRRDGGPERQTGRPGGLEGLRPGGRIYRCRDRGADQPAQSRGRLHRRRRRPSGGYPLRPGSKNRPGAGVEKDLGRRGHSARDVRFESGRHGGRVAHFKQRRQPRFRT